MNTPILLKTQMGNQLPSNCHVIASAHYVEPLQAALAGSENVPLVYDALNADAPLNNAIIGDASLVVVEIDTTCSNSLGRISQIRRQRPDLPIIAAIASADVTLVSALLRQGVNDVVSLPFEADELVAQICDISTSAIDSPQPQLAPMTAIVGASGGVGATTVITHLAAALANSDEQSIECCLVDLDMQVGDATQLAGGSAAISVLDLLEGSERLDEDLVRNASMHSSFGFSVLGAPSTITPIEDVQVDELLRMLRLARSAFDHVLLELPGAWTNWSLSAACACDRIILIIDESVTSIRHAKRCLELFEVADIPSDAISIVVNRQNKKLFQAIKPKDIEQTLHREVIGTLPLDKGDLAKAADRNTLIWEENSRSAFGKQIYELAAVIAGESGGR